MPKTTDDPKCPHCGAKVAVYWKSCWLCGLELTPTADRDDAGSEPTLTSRSTLGTVGIAIGLLLSILLALIFVGLLMNRQYGGAIALAVLLVPAALITLTKSLQSRTAGVDLSFLDRVCTFLLSTAATLLTLVALGVAAFAALFVACIVSAGGNSGNMFR
ncbi:MAG: hypothetical protein EXS05_05755 [Planctomycetaceae bacterium]|nr:hypothetical protein [Planctomycetaceae bacterium]